MKNAFVMLLVFFTSCAEKKENLSQNETHPADSVSVTNMQIRTIKAADLKTGPGKSSPVISNAQKFIIPVPDLGQDGEPLIYPKDHPKADQYITDSKGKPIGKTGIIFFNFKDQSLQAATGDGKSVIIINEVTRDQALKLDQEIRKRQSDPDNLSLKELKQIISFAQKELKLSDMYNSSRSFIKAKMTSVYPDNDSEKNKNISEAYGLKKRDDRDVNQAIYLPGDFIFEGPAASPQKFTGGGVIVKQGKKMRGVQPDVFSRTYQHADGSPIKSVKDEILNQAQ